jgi:hypothetical protein
MKHRLLGPLVLTAVAACHVTLLGDLEVNWSIDDSSAASLCTTYGIDHWHILADGPERVSTDISCQGAWTTGTVLWSIEEGFYKVTVEAVDTGGSVLASRSDSNVDVVSGSLPRKINIAFTAADFSGGGGGKVNIYWNINGTSDGKAKGKSWDTCAEVGASKVEVVVDGVSSTHDCHAGGNMSTAVSVSAAPTVKARLLDSSGKEMTTWTPEKTADAHASEADTWEYVGEFFADSFIDLKNTMKGDYWFNVTYEGQSCTATSPNVVHQVSLLSLKDGTAVNPPPDVCNASGGSCTPVDGASFASCTDQDQKIVDTIWGEYKMKLSGTLDTSMSYEICWEKEFDILIGAGTENPTQSHDVPRFSSTGNCTP